MKIELLYFGRPGENLKLSRESVQAPDTLQTLGELLAWLRSRDALWEQELAEKRVRCAVNQEFGEAGTAIKDGDEVAVFSPISGG
jgi:molybdopterin synthase sulfur carrier subunit